ncbi:MAG: thioredoxin family protein [Clostridium sp.]|nr:thioredoxin family protein [Clostridium sp.]
MKAHAISAALAALLLATGCETHRQGTAASGNGSPRTVDYPLYEMHNSPTLDITRVELTDTATLLHIDARYRPGYWIRISSDTYLKADDRKYSLTGAEGVTPDSELWMPESGQAAFTLRFAPLPHGTRSFDFIESDCEDCFKIYGVDLTGKRTFDVPDEVPESMRRQRETDSVPLPILRSGTTTVRLHVLHYRPDCFQEPCLIVNTMLEGQQSYPLSVSPQTGEATVSFPLHGTAYAFPVFNNSTGGEILLAPGETAELYVDLRAIGYYRSFNRNEETGAPRPTAFQRLYASGTYADINNAINLLTDSPYYSMALYTGDFADYRMTSAEYAAHVAGLYRAYSDSIGRSALSPLMKELNMLHLRQEVLAAIDMADYLREQNYRHEHRQWDRRIPVEGIDPLKPEDARTVCSLFDINDPKLLMGGNASNYVSAMLSAKFDWMQLAGIEKGVVADLRRTNGYTAKAKDALLTEADLARLDSMDIPAFYREAFTAMQQKASEQLAAMEGKAKIEVTPDVPDEKLFDAIVEPHKGKVIVVDFWNTWCGPCRAAIKANEPLKSTTLKSDDLVWIYIANETSPQTTYKTMIPDIQGLHYRLNDRQWKVLCEKFNVDGIPFYVLVQKDGEYKAREDFRNHKQLEKTVREELNRQ